jgi:hypothetical protein
MSVPRGEIAPPRAAGWLVALAVAFTFLGVFLAAYLVSWDAEWSYVTLGGDAVSGRIGLFQDELVGERLPLPYYLIGLVEVAAGPTLLGARLASLAAGVSALVLTFVAARALAGPAAGLLAAAFLATHTVVAGYFAAASYFGLCAALVAGGVAAVAAIPRPWGSLLAMACFTALAFSRANLAVLAPAVLIALVFTARSRVERLAIVAVCGLPPLLFFLWSWDHLKILAYAPGLDRLVAPLGYRSGYSMGGQDVFAARGVGESALWFAKRHASWLAASVLLAGAGLVAHLWGATARWPPGMLAIAALAVYALAWQVVIFRIYLKSVAASVVAFAPLWAIVLGCAAATLLRTGALPRPWRLLLAFGLAALLLMSPTFSRHAAMPRPLPEQTFVGALSEAAVGVRSVVPPGARTFVFGNPLPAFLAGAELYLRQTSHQTTLVTSSDRFAIRRSGLWGRDDLERWLGHEAHYAIVEPAVMAHLRTVAAYAPLMARMESLLAEHFTPAAEVGGPGGTPRQYVYVRRRPP